MGAIDRYNSIQTEIESKDKEIQEYEKIEIIKEYKKLIKKRNSLLGDKKKIYPEARFEEFDKCDHLVAWVKGFSNNRNRARYHHSYLCVKCGLATIVKDYPRYSLNKEQKIMDDYLSHKYPFYKPDRDMLPGTSIINLQCDPDLAMAIYKEIIKLHPGIEDEKAIKLFDKTLEEVLSLKNEKDKKAYAKRLGLDPKSIRW